MLTWWNKEIFDSFVWKKKKKKDVSVAMTKACSFYKSTRYIKHQGPILKTSLALEAR